MQATAKAKNEIANRIKQKKAGMIFQLGFASRFDRQRFCFRPGCGANRQFSRKKSREQDFFPARPVLARLGSKPVRGGLNPVRCGVTPVRDGLTSLCDELNPLPDGLNSIRHGLTSLSGD
jgi:hypothetical protein